jgi:thioredoxin reductase (NADPH)
MSQYLIDRVSALPNVTLHMGTRVAAVERDRDTITAVGCEGPQGSFVLNTSHLFFFTGATPNTGWLAHCGVKTDEKGFVLTGHVLQSLSGYVPSALETSVRGVFAIGDVRSGSIKRVAAAAGEGAAVVALIHEYLAAQREHTGNAASCASAKSQ